MRRRSRPSPALIVAVLALVAALAGTAVAADPVATTSVSKKKTKKIAKQQAKKQINKLAPGLSVLSAETANFAGAMDAYAHVNEDGSVDASRSRNITSANVSQPLGNVGVYCFINLPDFKTVQATQDGPPTGVDALVTVHVFTPGIFCPGGGVNSEVEVFTNAAGSAFSPNPEAFDIWLGN